MSSFIAQLEWRNATKVMDPTRKVSDDDLNKILKAIRLTPTSFGLQPFYVYVITDTKTREAIQAHAFNQRQITQCSHLLAFIACTDVQDRITDYFDLLSEGDSVKRDVFRQGYEQSVRRAFANKSEEQVKLWAQNQIYIAIGFAMAACAELAVDSCPMEGFIPAEVDRDLNLSQGNYSTLLLPIGYRSPDFIPFKKMRFEDSVLFRFK